MSAKAGQPRMSTRRSAALNQVPNEPAAQAESSHSKVTQPKQELQNIYKKSYPISDGNAVTKVEVKQEPIGAHLFPTKSRKSSTSAQKPRQVKVEAHDKPALQTPKLEV